ncbi:hypothetical protein BN2497_14131 [Janthinobacterium sp. CG23_2]|nr:hypothetical protein BN2497_14131 [Janthinobacterium sp. CG23_2]CUU33463.1 hypothetical protein BN3177_14131 [Janthinobacterium sp. CG23_2]
MKPILHKRLGALLFFMMLGFAAMTTAQAGERRCTFYEGPSNDGNVFEPPRWPGSLTPGMYVQPGIVRAGRDDFYQFIAWRALAGMPLDTAAQERLRPFDPCWLTGTSEPRDFDPHEDPALKSALQAWQTERARAGAPKLAALAIAGPDSSVLNCPADAFRNATRTLGLRLASDGRGAALLDWIAGQDAVFANCAAPTAMPADAPAGAPEWLRMDRAYQQAAAHFYRAAYPEAAARFDAIAQDPASPWRQLAPYLAARADVRAATAVGYGKVDAAPMASALKRLDPLADAADDTPLRADARRLRQLVLLRTAPAQVLARLDTELGSAAPSATIGQDVRDYSYAWRASAPAERAQLAYGAWLAAMRSAGSAKAAPGDALRQWESTQQLPWLVAALTLAKPQTPGALLAAAQALAPTSPAYLTARYHLARLAARDADAIAIVDAALALRPALSADDANAFKRIGLARARNLDDAGRFIVRSSALPAHGEAPVAAMDVATFLNTGLPLDMLLTLAQRKTLPPKLRAELETVAWTRALPLARPDVATRLAPAIKKRFAGAAALVDQMLAETDPALRRGIGAMLLARYPGMVGNVSPFIGYQTDPAKFAYPNMRASNELEQSRENWWRVFAGGDPTYGKRMAAPAMPAFLTAGAAATLRAERATLAALPSGTDYLAGLVMEHAAREPRDARLPQALSMLIRAHGGDARGQYTVPMFKHLHKYFARNEWAKRTPTHR